MNLLGHAKDGSRALIQHPDGNTYWYSFGQPFNSQYYTRAYVLVDDVETAIVPDDWETDMVDDHQFDTIDKVEEYLRGYVAGLEAEADAFVPLADPIEA